METVGITKYAELEEKFAKFVGNKYAVAVNTGTASLHLALVALGVGEGDEVIVPDFTMSACGFAVAYTGAKVVTVDCGEDFNIDVSKIEEKITAKTKAIMPVHIYGRVCNMPEIMEIAKRHNLFVVEDASEVHGGRVGYGDVTCFSFYRNKIIHGEEGGIITTNSRELYEDMQDLKSMAFGKEHNYFHSRIGFNYRMPESQAIMILNSLEDFYKNIKERRRVESAYQKHIPTQTRDSVWVYDFLTDNKDTKVSAIPEARHFFKPLSTMPMFEQSVGTKALEISKTGMYLPVTPGMQDSEVDTLVAKLNSVV